MSKEQVRINNVIWTVPGHVVQDIKRLVSPYGEDKEPAEDATTGTNSELGAKLKASQGKLKVAYKKVGALEKDLAELKKATTGPTGGGE